MFNIEKGIYDKVSFIKDVILSNDKSEEAIATIKYLLNDQELMFMIKVPISAMARVGLHLLDIKKYVDEINVDDDVLYCIEMFRNMFEIRDQLIIAIFNNEHSQRKVEFIKNVVNGKIIIDENTKNKLEQLMLDNEVIDLNNADQNIIRQDEYKISQMAKAAVYILKTQEYKYIKDLHTSHFVNIFRFLLNE